MNLSQRLRELEELRAKATQGEWQQRARNIPHYSHEITGGHDSHGGWDEYSVIARTPGASRQGNEGNAAFIAAAPSAVALARELMALLVECGEAITRNKSNIDDGVRWSRLNDDMHHQQIAEHERNSAADALTKLKQQGIIQ